MESLGKKLQNARAEKKLSHDQVSRETNIAISYIEALESENFSTFPGEAYLIGFLKNYGAYLELDITELLDLYRKFKQMEQQVPMELLKSPSVLPKIMITAVLVLVALGLAGGGVFFLLNRPSKPLAAVSTRHSPQTYEMSTSSFNHRFYQGDSILVPVGNNQYKLELAHLGETITIKAPGGSIILDLGQEAELDLSSDGVPDLRITVSDFAKNNSGMGVQLRLDTTAIAPSLPSAAGAIETASAAGGNGITMIFSSPNPYPFTLQSSFQGFCMFRWEILFERDRRERNERYFQRSEDLNIAAQNGIRIWASNAQAAKFQVIGGGKTMPLEFGAAGEVVVVEIRWVRDEDNRYRLILTRLETGT